MVRAIDLAGGEFRYVVEDDRESPEHEQTKFLMRPLTFGERLEIENLRSASSSYNPANGMMSHTRSPRMADIEILHRALLGWENFHDDKGLPIGFEKPNGRIAEASLARIDPWITELAEEAWERSTLGKDAKKNS